MFIPKETREALATENARLLLQAQSNIGLLSGQIAAGEEGTRKQVEWYEKQQQQQQQQQQQHTRTPTSSNINRSHVNHRHISHVINMSSKVNNMCTLNS